MRRFGLGLAVVMVMAAGIATRAEAGGFNVGAGVGLVDPNGAGSAPWFTLNARRAVGDRVVIEPELGYWSRKDSSPGVDNSISDASVGLNVLYQLTGKNRRARTRVFAGAGIGAHLVQSEAVVAGYDDVQDTELKQGMHLIATADRRIGGSIRLFIGFRSDLVADLGQSKVYGGIRLSH